MSNSIDQEWLQRETGERALDVYLRSGILIPTDLDAGIGTSCVRLEHMLTQSYLVSRILSRDEESWTKRNFEGITTQGSNFESLGLVLEQVTDGQADRFVRAVDNWNYWAAAYLLGEDRHLGERVSPSLRMALLLLLGLRRFSSSLSTSIQASDALRLHGGQFAEAVLEAEGHTALVAIARASQGDETWWGEWLGLYECDALRKVDRHVIQCLASEDGLIGWTAANVLSQLPLSRRHMELIGRALDDSDPVVRWRAIHAMGGAGDITSALRSYKVFNEDSSRWVRYGALRTFVQVVARLEDRSERRRQLANLASLGDQLTEDTRWAREIERAANVSDPPSGWVEDYGQVLERMWSLATSVEEQDRWRSVSASLRTGWRQPGTDLAAWE
jgi:hypothetical protein